MKSFKKLLSYFILILSILLVIVMITLKFFSKDTNIKPFGIQILKVQSNSMNPEFRKEDIIVIKKEKEYEVGDIITFKTKDGNLITHRIIEKNENEFITKGDGNNTKDEEKITSSCIQGKVIFVFKK